MSETQETKACPWCGETILAVAKKCKHCGEYLDADAGARGAPTQTEAEVKPVWHWTGFLWRCNAHNKVTCSSCRMMIAPPRRGPRRGERTNTRRPARTLRHAPATRASSGPGRT